MRKSLSIVIPAYNEERHLAACLDAIAEQTDIPDEVIVVDNNSADRTRAIAKLYPFVTLLSEKNQGVTYARNTGFNAVTSDIIGRIDADTLLPPDWVKNAKALFEHKGVAAITGPVGYYDMPLSETNYWVDHQIRSHLYKGAPHIPFIFGSNMAISKRAWGEVQTHLCHTHTIHEDLDLAIHLAETNKRTVYDRSLIAATSGRRYDDSFSAFRHYMQVYWRTYTEHNIRSVVPWIATAFYWMGYFTCRYFRKEYDPVTGKHVYVLFQKGHRARKSPVGSSH